jgi:hypothetical protein
MDFHYELLAGAGFILVGGSCISNQSRRCYKGSFDSDYTKLLQEQNPRDATYELLLIGAVAMLMG